MRPDTFDFSRLTDSTETEMDTIMDFEEGSDLIDLSDLGVTLSDFGSALTYDIVNGYTVIHDADSDFAVKLMGEHELAHSDFILQ